MNEEQFEELRARLRAGIEAANQGRIKDLGDFAQYAEEPAWKAELSADVECAIGLNQDCGGAEGVHALRDHVLKALLPHIQAAEQRGFFAGAKHAGEPGHSAEILRQVAAEFSADAARSDEPRKTEILSGVAYLLRLRADSIDPESP